MNPARSDQIEVIILKNLMQKSNRNESMSNNNPRLCKKPSKSSSKSSSKSLSKSSPRSIVRENITPDIRGFSNEDAEDCFVDDTIISSSFASDVIEGTTKIVDSRFTGVGGQDSRKRPEAKGHRERGSRRACGRRHCLVRVSSKARRRSAGPGAHPGRRSRRTGGPPAEAQSGQTWASPGISIGVGYDSKVGVNRPRPLGV